MRRGGLALALALAACSGDPAPPVPTPSATPMPRPTPSPRPLKPGELPTPELDAAPPLPGRWRFQASANGSAARYEQGERTVFAVRCDPQAKRIVFVHPGQGTAIRLYVADAAATFPADRIDGTLEAAVTTGQTFLDALARTDAIAVGTDAGAAVRLSGDDAIGIVIRSCRPGGGRR